MQSGAAQRDHGHGTGVGGIGFATMTGIEHPGPGRELGGNVENRFAVGDQALREVFAHAVAALDRPHPVGSATAFGEHPPVTVVVGAETPLAEGAFTTVDDLDRGGPFVRIDTDDHWAHVVSSPVGNGRRGGQRYFELGKPLLTHNPATVFDRTHAMSEPHPGTQVGSR